MQSQIFDALQKSESERSGARIDTASGCRIIARRAEQDAATKWEANTPPTEAGRSGIAGENGSHGGAASNGAGKDRSSGPSTAGTDAEERLAFFSKIQSLRVTLAPESRLVFLSDRESPTAEAMRLLSVRLRDLRRIRPLKSVLITSSIPREGKTTISSNLSCALAHGVEEKVLVIEGDVRIPSLRQMFGIDRVPGLCEFVQEDRNLSDSIYHLDGAGVWILPAGQVPSNPLEVLQSPKAARNDESISKLL